MRVPSAPRVGLDAYVYVGGKHVYLHDIPKEHYNEIAGFLRSQGRAPTAAEIVDVWVAGGSPGEQLRYADIPAPERSRIAEDLVKSGLAPTERAARLLLDRLLGRETEQFEFTAVDMSQEERAQR
jgi:hypothetical protein